MEKRTSRQNWIRATWEWLVGEAIQHWPAIATVVGGAVMTYLAIVSEWLSPYGPVAWGAAGILAMLLFALIYLVYGFARVRTASAFYTESKASASTVNVLAPTHTHERINFADFFHPFYRPVEGIRFEGCELFGPANIVLESCTLLRDNFSDCEVVIVRPDRRIMGATKFIHCSFLECTFFRTTLLMNLEVFNSLPDNIRRGLPVISDGRIGDV